MPLRFSLRQLEYFIAVGETGGVASAASRIGVSSPSISAAIAALEAEFGVQLFLRRHAQSLVLTAAGRQLLLEAKGVVASADAMVSTAADIGGTVSGQLSVGCLSQIAAAILPDLRRSFRTAFAAVTVAQYPLDHPRLADELLAGRVDLALTFDFPLPAGIDFEPFAALPFWVMLAPAHPLAGRPAITPEELAGEPMVLLDLPPASDRVLALFERAGVAPLIAERTRDVEMLRSLVANGFGHALVATRTATDLAPDGKRLAFVALSGGMPRCQLGLASVAGARERPAAAAFRNHVRLRIAQSGLPGCVTV